MFEIWKICVLGLILKIWYWHYELIFMSWDSVLRFDFMLIQGILDDKIMFALILSKECGIGNNYTVKRYFELDLGIGIRNRD